MNKTQAKRLAKASAAAKAALAELLEATQAVRSDEETEHWRETIKSAMRCGVGNFAWEAASRLDMIAEQASA